MDVASFEEIREAFEERVRRIVWCSAATVDAHGRPRTRMLHPIWEGLDVARPLGWITSRPGGVKGRHLAAHPHLALTYWDPQHLQVYVEGRARWEHDPAEKRRVWELFRTTPEPYGFDPAAIGMWKTPDDSDFALIRLEPRRIEVSGLHEMARGQPALVWRAI